MDGPRRPNLLVIMTDDQTLASVASMGNVNRQLVAEGTEFEKYYISFPNCCPSRATYYTGSYAHNTGVEDNVPPLGGAKKFRDEDTVAVRLQQAGYFTTSVGKYLNGWGEDGQISPPPGWSRWFGLIDPTTYSYFDYKVSVDGVERSYGNRPEDYQTDVLGAEVVKTIRDRAGVDRSQPWFVSFTPLAPHAEKPEVAAADAEKTPFRWALPKPAPRHEKTVTSSAPRPPSFNSDNAGKPAEMQAKEPIGQGLERLIDDGYRRELESLASADEWVGKIVDALRETNQLDNTVIMFTSDNGYFHGEHRLAFQKYYLYEQAVHVPLIVRGGPFTKGGRIAQMAGNVDLAPTLLALAGLPVPEAVDGIDLTTLVRDPKAYPERAILLENRAHNGRQTKAIHTGRYVYMEHESGEKELYDLESDPDQLKNLSGGPTVASLESGLAKRLAELRSCSGIACRTG